MLVLTRKPGEKIVIGDNITVTVVEVNGNRVRLALDAPDDVHILRAELLHWQELPTNSGSRKREAQPARSTEADTPLLVKSR